MTREEAIKWLKDIHHRFNPTGENLENEGGDVHLQALDLAIEALSAEAATGDYPNDLISRSALMEYCSNQKSKSIDNNDIARFPSAEARPTGEWIPVSDIRKLEDIVYMHIDSLEGTRNIVEAGMLSAWKEVAEYVDGMLGEDGEA